jgi:hypothetical protein
MSPETNVSSASMSPLFETPSFYSDLNAKMTLFEGNQTSSTATDIHDHPRQSKTHEPIITTPPIRQISGYDAAPLSTLPPSIYNRSSISSIASLGATTTPRNSVSNKIAPAPAPPSPVSPKHSLSTTFQPISNTRFNPGHSPKPKARSHLVRTTSSKNQQQNPEKSTIIELEPSEQQVVPSKSAPLLGTSSKPTSTTKSSSSVFRRFITSGNNPEKTGVSSSSSTLLYPPTSDDERVVSPASSGNEDDDYRPLTSSSKHHHHQTPL